MSIRSWRSFRHACLLLASAFINRESRSIKIDYLDTQESTLYSNDLAKSTRKSSRSPWGGGSRGVPEELFPGVYRVGKTNRESGNFCRSRSRAASYNIRSWVDRERILPGIDLNETQAARLEEAAGPRSAQLGSRRVGARRVGFDFSGRSWIPVRQDERGRESSLGWRAEPPPYRLQHFIYLHLCCTARCSRPSCERTDALSVHSRRGQPDQPTYVYGAPGCKLCMLQVAFCSTRVVFLLVRIF